MTSAYNFFFEVVKFLSKPRHDRELSLSSLSRLVTLRTFNWKSDELNLKAFNVFAYFLWLCLKGARVRVLDKIFEITIKKDQKSSKNTLIGHLH
jgi:hypothetical protein